MTRREPEHQDQNVKQAHGAGWLETLKMQMQDTICFDHWIKGDLEIGTWSGRGEPVCCCDDELGASTNVVAPGLMHWVGQNR